mmetsp:Transcript_46676/g.123276  ORF Transcript_46676/g.123276 Transcript_46676/m.123276 type:complete len:202 (+) Transcript_46676:552-1157(+)
MRAQRIAPIDMRSGCEVQYMLQPSRLCVPNLLQAILIAFTSAVAVASRLSSTVLVVSAITWPSLVTTAPNGSRSFDLPRREPSSAAEMAMRIIASWRSRSGLSSGIRAGGCALGSRTKISAWVAASFSPSLPEKRRRRVLLMAGFVKRFMASSCSRPSYTSTMFLRTRSGAFSRPGSESPDCWRFMTASVVSGMKPQREMP